MKESIDSQRGRADFVCFLNNMLKTSYYGNMYKTKVKFTKADLDAMQLLYIYVFTAIDFGSHEVILTSGFRNLATNQHLKGSLNSQHMYGEAMDFTCNDMPAMFEYIRQNLEFDQLIWERGTKFCPAWIHVSYSSRHKNRKQIIYNIR